MALGWQDPCFSPINLAFVVQKRGKARRANDAFTPKPDDTLFAAEVKRYGRQLGLNARSLAEKMGLADQGCITRDLGKKRRGTQASTAEAFAEALGLPKPFLRICATGKLTSEDYDRAINAFRALFAEAAPQIDPSRYSHLWAEIKERYAAAAAQTKWLVLADAYLTQLRFAANKVCGIEETREPIVLLAEVVRPLGIDVEDYTTPISDDVLGLVWISLRAKLPTNDQARVLDLLRSILKDRGTYRPELDTRLGEWMSNPTEMAYSYRGNDA